jgi:hypothetical protein
MVHVQVVSRDASNLQAAIKKAINDGAIKSFAVTQVKGGLRIKHKKHIGEIRFTKTPGPLLAHLVCKNRSKEWQLLEAFVGRLTYHFKNQIASISIQLEADD